MNIKHDNSKCWQYKRKIDTLKDDLWLYPPEFTQNARIENFEFSYVPKDNKVRCQDIKNFIERYEWLGKMPVWVTHRFIATLEDEIMCAVVMATPNAFSTLLGEEYKNREKMISRGASISFAPKNVGSWMVMQAIRWMSKNTDFVLFTAYADPMAGELGTIYQACNFWYLGQKFGGSYSYNYPGSGMVSSSYFNQRSTIKRIAIEGGVEWRPEYIKKNKTGSKRIIAWENMPEPVEENVRFLVKKKRNSCEKIKLPKKHKYAYVLGRRKAQTQHLRNLFLEKNDVYEYPKERGK